MCWNTTHHFTSRYGNIILQASPLRVIFTFQTVPSPATSAIFSNQRPLLIVFREISGKLRMSAIYKQIRSNSARYLQPDVPDDQWRDFWVTFYLPICSSQFTKGQVTGLENCCPSNQLDQYIRLVQTLSRSDMSIPPLLLAVGCQTLWKTRLPFNFTQFHPVRLCVVNHGSYHGFVVSYAQCLCLMSTPETHGTAGILRESVRILHTEALGSW